jgi:hypothetical protein
VLESRVRLKVDENFGRDIADLSGAGHDVASAYPRNTSSKVLVATRSFGAPATLEASSEEHLGSVHAGARSLLGRRVVGGVVMLEIDS